MADWTNDVYERKKKLSEVGQKISDYKPFRYNADEDPLYRQLADRYAQMGQQASRNVQGQAAALTGGYGNSYAAQVGNQAYQQYLTALNDQLPSLQANAQTAWANEYDQLLQLYQMMQAMGTGTGGGTSKVSAAAANPLVQQAAVAAIWPGLYGPLPKDVDLTNMYEEYKKLNEAQSGGKK
jgi:hypothetical protein